MENPVLQSLVILLHDLYILPHSVTFLKYIIMYLFSGLQLYFIQNAVFWTKISSPIFCGMADYCCIEDFIYL